MGLLLLVVVLQRVLSVPSEDFSITLTEEQLGRLKNGAPIGQVLIEGRTYTLQHFGDEEIPPMNQGNL
jgi:hypothetical protein